MPNIEKKVALTPKDFGSLLDQYKQIEQAFNTRIAEIVKSVLPKNFDMSKVRWIDSVFQELNSPQNLRKEGTVSIQTDSVNEANMLVNSTSEEISKVTSGSCIFDNKVVIYVTRDVDSVNFSIAVLEEKARNNEIIDSVGNTVKSVDGILKTN